MPFFSYKGRSAKGEIVQGVLEGANSSALAGHLFSIGITPIDISPTTAPSSEARSSSLSLAGMFGEKIQTIDLMLFSRQMYTLLKAGIPIIRAFTGLQASTVNKSLARVIGELRESLESGRELSAALSQHPKVFTAFYVSMVRVGETTGMLEQVFMRLFEHLEFEKFMREQVKAALRYPSFVMLAMAVALVIIN
ncbi:MAG TPA: type II secretion system F family protein, partial [Methylophilaceae bacterium]|nr:type II secretion system F family protein [Methylophilaceae bacterium]